MSTGLDLITNALYEINAFKAGEAIPSEDANFCLSKLNRWLDQANARKAYVYAQQFLSSFVLTPNLTPHTIGPSGTFSVSQRPVSIENAAIILNNVTPNVTNPLNLRDHEWWANQRIKTIANALPVDLYYEPDWPNGSLFFWPVPNTAYGVELDVRTIITNFASLSTTYTYPPGYEEAITMSLAENLCTAYEVPELTAVKVSSQAMRARAIIQGPNLKAPLMSTRDFGMPNKGSSNRTNWNYRTGLTTS